MIAAYADPEPLTHPGDSARIHVSTTARTFMLEFYRCADGLTHVWSAGPFQGTCMAAGRSDSDWDWPAYEVTIPADAPPGVYLANAVELEDNANRVEPSLVGFDGSCLLAIRPRTPASGLLYKLPYRTYQAYNPVGGGSLYVNHAWGPDGASVSLRRPGGGTGGHSAEQLDVYEPRTPRQSFWHWDAQFLAWAERTGHRLDVVLDTQLDAAPNVIAGYRGVVSAGHDEYWTQSHRELMRDYVAGGGGLAIFGANTCWWRADVDAGVMTVDKDRSNPATGPGLWWRLGDPENRLIGLSYRSGGGWWGGARPATRYTVTTQADSLLNGVDRDALGDLTTLAGYEADGHSFPDGDPWSPDGLDGAPSGLVVLAHAELHQFGEHGWHPEPREPEIESPRTATIAYCRPAGALVFNAGTVDWSLHLQHPCVARFTHNVLTDLEALGRSASLHRSGSQPGLKEAT